MKRYLNHILLLAASTLLAGACVDSPSEPLQGAVDQTPLASSFESLADEMATVDTERSEELRWAALAVRAGVAPTALDLTNAGVPEVYDAFVHSVSWVSASLAVRPVAHRNLIAWRRGGDLLQVLLVSMAVDSAPVLHPYSMRPTTPGDVPSSPVAGAKAAYFERGVGAGSSWLGIGGVAKIVEKPTGHSCGATDANRPSGVTCQRTRFGVRLNALFARTPTRDSREVSDGAATRRIIVPDQDVAGAKLIFSCSAPRVDGC
jgi:hypothetical protein